MLNLPALAYLKASASSSSLPTLTREECRKQRVISTTPTPATSTDDVNTPPTIYVEEETVTIAGSRRSVRRVFCRAMRGGADGVGWVADADVPNCMVCASEFGVFLSRHHCRCCGNVVCNPCSDNDALILELFQLGNQRVCRQCYWGQTPVCVRGGRVVRDLLDEYHEHDFDSDASGQDDNEQNTSPLHETETECTNHMSHGSIVSLISHSPGDWDRDDLDQPVVSWGEGGIYDKTNRSRKSSNASSLSLTEVASHSPSRLVDAVNPATQSNPLLEPERSTFSQSKCVHVLPDRTNSISYQNADHTVIQEISFSGIYSSSEDSDKSDLVTDDSTREKVMHGNSAESFADGISQVQYHVSPSSLDEDSFGMEKRGDNDSSKLMFALTQRKSVGGNHILSIPHPSVGSAVRFDEEHTILSVPNDKISHDGDIGSDVDVINHSPVLTSAEIAFSTGDSSTDSLVETSTMKEPKSRKSVGFRADILLECSSIENCEVGKIDDGGDYGSDDDDDDVGDDDDDDDVQDYDEDGNLEVAENEIISRLSDSSPSNAIDAAAVSGDRKQRRKTLAKGSLRPSFVAKFNFFETKSDQPPPISTSSPSTTRKVSQCTPLSSAEFISTDQKTYNQYSSSPESSEIFCQNNSLSLSSQTCPSENLEAPISIASCNLSFVHASSGHGSHNLAPLDSIEVVSVDDKPLAQHLSHSSSPGIAPDGIIRAPTSTSTTECTTTLLEYAVVPESSELTVSTEPTIEIPIERSRPFEENTTKTKFISVSWDDSEVAHLVSSDSLIDHPIPHVPNVDTDNLVSVSTVRNRRQSRKSFVATLENEDLSFANACVRASQSECTFTPTPSFVIKTLFTASVSPLVKQKVFVNVCLSECVPEYQFMDEDTDVFQDGVLSDELQSSTMQGQSTSHSNTIISDEVGVGRSSPPSRSSLTGRGSMSLAQRESFVLKPFVYVGESELAVDKDGESSVVCDIVINPSHMALAIHDEVANGESRRREFICGCILESIEATIEETLDKDYRLRKIIHSYKSSITRKAPLPIPLPLPRSDDYTRQSFSTRNS